MPNNIYNLMNVYGEMQYLNEFKEHFRYGNCALSFEKIIPMPKDTSHWRDEHTPGWYNWAVTNWGTKWDAWDISLSEEVQHLFYEFTTAWSSPFPIYDKLKETFPELVFDIVSYDPINDWAYELEASNGTYTKFIEERILPSSWPCPLPGMLCFRKDLINHTAEISLVKHGYLIEMDSPSAAINEDSKIGCQENNKSDFDEENLLWELDNL
jgi:hypothetical protein